MTTEKVTTKKRTLEGIVVSVKMDKTIVVRVDHVRSHSKYRKQYKVSKRYNVHDQENKYKVGDTVQFVECRPLSKNKRWRVAK